MNVRSKLNKLAKTAISKVTGNIPISPEQSTVLSSLLSQVEAAKANLRQADNAIKNYCTQMMLMSGVDPNTHHINWDKKIIEKRPTPPPVPPSPSSQKEVR